MSVLGMLSDDARVVLLLCSSVAAARGEDARPLGPAGWAKVAERLVRRGMTPAGLMGLGPQDIEAILHGLDVAADVVVRQLARSGQLAFELDRLAARGIGALTLADDDYPTRLRDRLGSKAPPVLFTAGDRSILEAGGVAIVGSRDVDEACSAFAAAVAAGVARNGGVVVSGGARGVDQLAMQAAFEAGGRVAGMLPEGIERRIREPSTRAALAEGVVVIASPYNPGAGFSAGAAMGRNKLVYALSDAAVVVASAAGSGGTWAGAEEALRARWVPVFVRRAEAMPEGNRVLIEHGGIPLDIPELPSVIPSSGVPGDTRMSRAPEDVAPFEQPSLGLLE